MYLREDTFPGSKQAPPIYQEILRKYGQNPYGENLFRVSFLPSRCHTVGGYWEKEQDFRYRRVPKYGIREYKWMIEKWLPNYTYGTPESWERLTLSQEGFLQLGPYPSTGEYECVQVFSVGRGPEGYVPLEPGLVDLQARMIWMGRTQTIWDIRNNIRTEEEIKKAQQDRVFDSMWEEIQHSRDGLTLGAAGAYNKEDAVTQYKKMLLNNKDSWMPEAQFTKGFNQQEEL